MRVWYLLYTISLKIIDENYLNEQIEEIKKLQVSGHTKKQILDGNEFCY
ncbi:hypothetical protein [Clostridium sp. DJ247]|nr:hypothetical protein [Clostridium sp. DJ247]MBC2579028.1 hypothetical protein [Clostridium sp. DJ247]